MAARHSSVYQNFAARRIMPPKSTKSGIWQRSFDSQNSQSPRNKEQPTFITPFSKEL